MNLHSPANHCFSECECACAVLIVHAALARLVLFVFIIGAHFLTRNLLENAFLSLASLYKNAECAMRNEGIFLIIKYVFIWRGSACVHMCLCLVMYIKESGGALRYT